MKDNQTKYMRGKIHWWIILILWAFYVWAIFAYIHQWGNNPIPKIGLVILGGRWVVMSVGVSAMRHILTIDNKFVFITFGQSWEIKVHITQIKDVSVVKLSFSDYKKMLSPRGTQYLFDFTRQAVKIDTKSGNFYQITIKDAQKIKEEIEKRMLTSNNITSS
jgi:hypothetical protein